MFKLSICHRNKYTHTHLHPKIRWYKKKQQQKIDKSIHITVEWNIYFIVFCEWKNKQKSFFFFEKQRNSTALPLLCFIVFGEQKKCRLHSIGFQFEVMLFKQRWKCSNR